MRTLVAVLFSIAVLGLAGSAGAATISPGTLMNVGDTLEIRDDGAGSTAGVDLDITLTDYDIATATWTFTVTVVSGGLGGDDLAGLGVTIVDECSFTYYPNMNCLDDLGTIAGPGVDVTPETTIGTYTATALFSFDAGGDGLLNVGETSDQLFVSYGAPLLRTTGTPPQSIVNFMIDPAAVGVGDQNLENPIVPEPTTLLLLGLGIGGLAVSGRRRGA